MSCNFLFSLQLYTWWCINAVKNSNVDHNYRNMFHLKLPGTCSTEQKKYYHSVCETNDYAVICSKGQECVHEPKTRQTQFVWSPLKCDHAFSLCNCPRNRALSLILSPVVYITGIRFIQYIMLNVRLTHNSFWSLRQSEPSEEKLQQRTFSCSRNRLQRLCLKY